MPPTTVVKTMNGWERTKWVLDLVERHELGPTASIVLVALTTYADNTTGEAWPAKKPLGKRTNLSVQRITRAMRELESKGIVRTLHVSRTPGQGIA